MRRLTIDSSPSAAARCRRFTLSAFLRSLAAFFVVAVTSVGVVSAPTAHAAYMWESPPGNATRTVAKTAGKIGTRALPLRFAACGTIPSLVICTAGAAGMYWLTETDSGREFGGHVMDGFKGSFWPLATSSAQDRCSSTVDPVAWGQHQVSFSYEILGEWYSTNQHMPSLNVSCVDQFESPRGDAIATLDGHCITATGQLYVQRNALFRSRDGSVFSLCNLSSTDWLIGVAVKKATGSLFSNESAGFYKNPTWNGTPGANPDWWNDNVAKPTTRATITCRKADGSTYTRTVTVDGVQDPPLDCGADGSLIRRAADLLHSGGQIGLYDAAVGSEFVTQYPECFSGGAGCDMGVLLDGMLCEYGRSGCADWWQTAQQNPERVECSWGPYVLPYGDCRELRNAYVSSDGAWTPRDSAPGATPIPYYPTNPDRRPGPGTGGGDPAWLDPAVCGPVPAARMVKPGMEYGLEPIALQGARCFFRDHPDFMFTSGFRSAASSEWYSEHPHGLAIDVAPPNWQSPAGRQRGWDATAYWIQNARELGVRIVIFGGKIWQPSIGWRVYEGPNPHDDHVHISFDPHAQPGRGGAPNPNPARPGYPEPNPDPSRPVPHPGNPDPTPTTPPGDPNPNPNPGEPNPTFPETGTNPTDPDGCMAAAWSWNPADWVLVPVKCALQWAFVPSAPALRQAEATITEATTGTGVPTWIDTLQSVPPVMGAPQTPTQGCMGPPMRLPDPFPTIYLFEACDGFRATMAGYTKTFMTVGLIVGTMLTTTTLITRGFGYDASTGGSAKT